MSEYEKISQIMRIIRKNFGILASKIPTRAAAREIFNLLCKEKEMIDETNEKSRVGKAGRAGDKVYDNRSSRVDSTQNL